MINLQTLSLHRLRDRSLEVERFYDKGMKIANLLHPLDVQFLNEWGLKQYLKNLFKSIHLIFVKN